MRIAHIINPVKIGPQSDLSVAQPFVHQTMRIARDFAADLVTVDLVAVIYDEDRDAVPPWMTLAAPLTRSILDFGSFAQPRKLPLLADILANGAAAAPDADYYIYSNADIILMPQTYRWIARRLAAGFDALTINRRTIRHDAAAGGLEEIWTAFGVPHEGHDFFVFSRELLPRLQLDSVVIGVPLIGWALNSNLAVLAQRYELIEDGHDLTKHLGEDRAWQHDERRDFLQHNIAAADRAFAALGVTREQMVIHRAGYRNAQRQPRSKRLLRRFRRLLKQLREIAARALGRRSKR
jgi:hypothetical protein